MGKANVVHIHCMSSDTIKRVELAFTMMAFVTACVLLQVTKDQLASLMEFSKLGCCIQNQKEMS